MGVICDPRIPPPSWKTPAFLPSQRAERFVTTRAGEEIGKNAGKNQPDKIWYAAIPLRAERSVFELLLGIGKELGLFPEELVPGKDAAGDEQSRRHPSGDPDPVPPF